MNANTIVRINDSEAYGLIRRSLYGLNLFSANGIEVSTRADPRIMFLKTLSRQEPCAACAGYLSLKDLVDDPVELFGSVESQVPYARVAVGLYGGSFYDLMQHPTQKSCFFPIINDTFWESATVDAQFNIRDVLEDDALSLLVGTVSLERFEQILVPFPGENALLQALAHVYRLIITTSGDGYSLEVYASDSAYLADLDTPIQEAVKVVETSEWHRQNKEKLTWDDEYDACLMLR